MRWERKDRSENLEDRRGESEGGLPGGFPGGLPGQHTGQRGGQRIGIPIPRGRNGRFSLTGLLVMLLVMWFLGINPLTLLGGAGGVGGGFDGMPDSTTTGLGGTDFEPEGSGASGSGGPGALPSDTTPDEEKQVDFVSFVLDDLQTTWGQLLPDYRAAKLVLFREATRSGCGVGQREMGPFYCPADEKVYVDLAFYDDLRARFGAPGDFAQAYVLAHEIGHHVQALTGIERQVRAEQQRRPDRANALSVRMELQADCLAGVWGHQAGRREVLEPGDIEEGLRAAAAIGDDRIQKMSGRGVHPESFTHGSSTERKQWLERGLASGNPDDCDTFGS
ncbi:MAG: neutral zinc metallopeptidase [Deltaproteobacteria bacterium]|nr:neutral zinc metallopeptidase [Deltaproteobacteria bacterium]